MEELKKYIIEKRQESCDSYNKSSHPFINIRYGVKIDVYNEILEFISNIENKKYGKYNM